MSFTERRVPVIQGEFRVSSDPDIVFTTILGSCVAACIRDPVASIGGMNHFLLPRTDRRRDEAGAEHYGVHLMELLVNELMKKGARRDRLEAKLFGGARVVKNLSDIGQNNAAFAEEFLKYESIPLVGKDVGGDRARRLQYWPASGRARQGYVATTDIVADEVRTGQRLKRELAGEIELF